MELFAGRLTTSVIISIISILLIMKMVNLLDKTTAIETILQRRANIMNDFVQEKYINNKKYITL